MPPSPDFPSWSLTTSLESPLPVAPNLPELLTVGSGAQTVDLLPSSICPHYMFRVMLSHCINLRANDFHVYISSPQTPQS